MLLGHLPLPLDPPHLHYCPPLNIHIYCSHYLLATIKTNLDNSIFDLLVSECLHLDGFPIASLYPHMSTSLLILYCSLGLKYVDLITESFEILSFEGCKRIGSLDVLLKYFQLYFRQSFFQSYGLLYVRTLNLLYRHFITLNFYDASYFNLLQCNEFWIKQSYFYICHQKTYFLGHQFLHRLYHPLLNYYSNFTVDKQIYC